MTTTAYVDSAWKGLYSAGGVSFLLAGVLLLSSFSLRISGGVVPSEADAYLRYFADQHLPLSVASGLFALAFVSLIPGVLILYLALKGVNRTYMLIGTGFAGLLIPFRLLEISLLSSQVGVGESYVAATSETSRAAYLAAFDLTKFIGFPIFLLGLLFSSVWIIATSVVMKKGFSRVIAYLGVVTSIAALVSLASEAGQGLGVVRGISLLISSLGANIWFIAVGSKLYKLGSAAT